MKNIHPNNILINGFIKSAERFSDRYGLVVENEKLTYENLYSLATHIAATIIENEKIPNSMVAIFAYRSKIAYVGILGILFSGKGYVPLNPKFPVERTVTMFNLSRCSTLIVGKECIELLKSVLAKLMIPITVILPDVNDLYDLPILFPQHRFLSSYQISSHEYFPKINYIGPENKAYLLFTSGSTGIPKGVAVSNRNVTSYIKYITQRYELHENDRFSQIFDMTFDLSVHDMFVCWEVGACLFCVPERFTIAPAKFIKDNQLSMWFSVPSVGMIMSKMRMLKPDSFPTLRYSLFCGEPLPSSLAEKWQMAAPNSVLENLYGPTETTIAITLYKWDNNLSPEECINGIVPIGWVFEGQRSAVIDQDKSQVPINEVGELCLSGSQVTEGYLNNPEKTAQCYIHIPSLGQDKWYRTGDLVKKDKNGCMYYLGRTDNQVKILGYRIELQEVDAVLSKASESDMVISIPWPVREHYVEGLIGVVCKSGQINECQVISYCKRFLPEYAVPKKIYFLDKLPLNTNGKIDRVKLREMLEDGSL